MTWYCCTHWSTWLLRSTVATEWHRQKKTSVDFKLVFFMTHDKTVYSKVEMIRLEKSTLEWRSVNTSTGSHHSTSCFLWPRCPFVAASWFGVTGCSCISTDGLHLFSGLVALVVVQKDGWTDGRPCGEKKLNKCVLATASRSAGQASAPLSKALFVIFRGHSESCRNKHLCEICSACSVTGWCESVHHCQPPPQPQPRNPQSHSAAPALRGRRLTVLVQGVSKIFYKCVDTLVFGSLWKEGIKSHSGWDEVGKHRCIYWRREVWLPRILPLVFIWVLCLLLVGGGKKYKNTISYT